MKGTSMISRRELLWKSGHGIGTLALGYLLGLDGLLAAPAGERANNLVARKPQFAPRAKSVIQLMQAGGPSQMDLFDPKPELQKRNGERHILPEDRKSDDGSLLLASPFEFAKYGRSGMDFSSLMKNTAEVADDLCMIRTMYSIHNAHAEAMIMLQTNKIFRGRPVMGSWITYALGSENQNLPGYVVLRDPGGYNANGPLNWEHGWLPALYGGTEFNTAGDPLFDLKPARPVPERVQQGKLDLLAKMNEEHKRSYPGNSELETRIRNYELAARIQLEAASVLDFSKESDATKKLYGLDDPETEPYGRRCLMARRLIEAGVRYVQVFPGLEPFLSPWDNHTNIKDQLEIICSKTDKPFMGLIKDLKARGLLDETVVMWAGEFGRQPVSQNGRGRDHNKNAFTVLMAGGGFKPGLIYGTTDDFGYSIVDKKVSIADLHATILHQLGVDHRKLTYTHSGREESLTDASITGAHVVGDVLTAQPVVS